MRRLQLPSGLCRLLSKFIILQLTSTEVQLHRTATENDITRAIKSYIPVRFEYQELQM